MHDTEMTKIHQGKILVGYNEACPLVISLDFRLRGKDEETNSNGVVHGAQIIRVSIGDGATNIVQDTDGCPIPMHA